MKWQAAATLLVCLHGTPALAATVDDLAARTHDDGKGHTLPYRLFVPAGYQRGKRYGLVLFLHGAGERGTDNRKQLIGQTAPLVFADAANQARWPVFLVAPQCPADQQWVAMPWGTPSGKGTQPAAPTWPLAAALALVDELLAEYPGIDPGQLHVTGLSMGGFGAWDAVVRNPKKFRAAVPICAGYDETKVAPIVTLPIWTFHAADDGTVPVQRTRDLVNALKALGGTAIKYTEYPASARIGHASWNPAYRDPALLPWMFGAPWTGAADAGAADASDARAETADTHADTVGADGSGRADSVADGLVSDAGLASAGPDATTAPASYDATRAPDPAVATPTARRDAAAGPEPDPRPAHPARAGRGCAAAGTSSQPLAVLLSAVAVIAARTRRRRWWAQPASRCTRDGRKD